MSSSAELYKIRLLEVSHELCSLKPYIEDEYRKQKLVPLKLIENFETTLKEHFDPLATWFSDVDGVVLLRIISDLVTNAHGNISIGCLKEMRKVIKSCEMVKQNSECSSKTLF
jgi:hypothetical protein